jgi:hypothetical protein
MQVKAAQRFRSTGGLFYPAHNPRPIFFKRPFTHEQAEMIARGSADELVAPEQMLALERLVGTPSRIISAVRLPNASLFRPT